MRKSHVLSRGNRWAIVAAAGISPLFLAAGASAQTFGISIGVRETQQGGATSAGIGNNGGTLGGIEWINLDGLSLVADGTWQQFTFNFGTDPVTAFAGGTANGTLEGTFGTLEHIRIRNFAETNNPITMYIDNMVNTVGGSPTLVSDWEPGDPIPATVNTEHMFQEPNFSGSTSGSIQPGSTSLVSDLEAQSGTQSKRINWAWNTTANTAWLRLTTFNATNQPNPEINIAPGSTLSFWLRAVIDVPLNFWTGPSGGNWNDPNNWASGEVPNSPNAVANLLAQTSPITINLDGFTQVNAIIFNSAAPNGYTVQGTETLSMEGPAGVARTLSVEAGNHTISTPIEVVTGFPGPTAPTPVWAINVTGAGNSLTTSGTITLLNGGTLNIDKSGQGTWITSRIESLNPEFAPVTLRVLGGTARLAQGSGTSRVDGLFMQGGTTPVGKLDITNNALVINYTETSPINTIRQQIGAAFNNGAWDGNGITSSSANAGQFGIGYADASELTSVPPIFGTVDSTTMLLRLTRYGDANLDGQVNLADFNRLAANFGSTEATWADGDFNYDGIINLADFNRLAANFGLQATGTDAPTPEDWSTLAAAVPEPSSLALVGLGALMAVRRRRA